MNAIPHLSPSCVTVGGRPNAVRQDGRRPATSETAWAAYIVLAVLGLMAVAGALAFGGAIAPADLVCFVGG